MIELPDKIDGKSNYHHDNILANRINSIIDYLKEREQPKQYTHNDEYKRLWVEAKQNGERRGENTYATVVDYELAIHSADKLIKELRSKINNTGE